MTEEEKWWEKELPTPIVSTEKWDKKFEEKAQRVSIEEICKQVLEHYKKISNMTCEWNSTIPNALLFYSQKETLLSSFEKEKEKVIFWKRSYDEELAHSKQGEERIKELEELIDTQNDTITQSEIRINEAESRLKILVEAVDRFWIEGNMEDLSKMLEEVKAVSIRFENIKWKHNSEIEIVDSLDDNDWP